MKLIVKLLPLDKPAADGSTVSRKVVEDYLNSDEYRDTIENLTATGGLTHIDRCLPSDGCGNSSDGSGTRPVKGIIGKDDLLILNKNITHAIEKIYIGDDGWVYAVLKVFDETLMDDDSAKRIKQLKGLIRNGVKLNSSAVIIAFWSSTESCERIVRVSGIDITLCPSWKRAGVVDVLDDEQTKDEGGLPLW